MSDIEQQRAGGVSHVHAIFAGKTKANVVLRKLQHAKFFVYARLMLPNPNELGQREVRKSRIAGPRDELRFSDLLG
jgi:hypothetical protein